MRTKLSLCGTVILILISLSACKKDLMEWLFDDGSFIECNVNGTYAKKEGTVNSMFENPELYMHYFYNGKDTFSFNLSKKVIANHKAYEITLFFSKNSLPVIGEAYQFREKLDNDSFYGYRDQFYAAAVRANLFFYECADTTLLPVDIRKKKIMLRTNIVTEGSLTFTKVDVEKGDINGLFQFEAKGISKRVPAASFEVSVTNGRFECYGVTLSRSAFGYGGDWYEFIY